MPIGGSGLGQAVPRLRRMAEAAGRDPAQLSVVPFGTLGSESKLAHYAEMGVNEVVLRVRSGDDDAMRAELESLTPLLCVAATLEAT